MDSSFVRHFYLSGVLLWSVCGACMGAYMHGSCLCVCDCVLHILPNVLLTVIVVLFR